MEMSRHQIGLILTTVERGKAKILPQLIRNIKCYFILRNNLNKDKKNNLKFHYSVFFFYVRGYIA